MKIMLVSDSYLPVVSGLTTVVHNLLQQLNRRNHKIYLICMGIRMRSVHTTKNKIELYKMPSFSNTIRPDYYIPLPSPLLMGEIIKSVKPDVIHLHTFWLIGFWSLYFAKRYQIPTVATCHGIPEFVTSYFHFWPSFLYKLVEKNLWRYYRWFLNQTNRVVAPSEFIKNQLTQHGVKTIINNIPMWIETLNQSFYKKRGLREIWRLPEDKTIFLYLGRLDSDKNLFTLIEALDLLKSAQAFLLFVGKGKEKEMLKKLVREKHLENCVRFAGYIPDSKIREIYQLSDVFLMPALYEAQSITVLQAISFGLPVIAADSGALKEIAQDFSKYCSTFNPDNLKSLAMVMQQFLANPKKERLKPPKSFFLKYDKKTILNKIKSLYASVISMKITPDTV